MPIITKERFKPPCPAPFPVYTSYGCITCTGYGNQQLIAMYVLVIKKPSLFIEAVRMFKIAFASIGFRDGKFYARVSFKLSGNNKADMAAKSALQFEVAKLKIPYTDYKCFIKFYAKSLWQIF